MPVIEVGAAPHLMPPDWRRAIDPGFKLTPEMVAFDSFVQSLRQIVLDAINGVDGTTMTLDEVVLESRAFDSRTENAADAWVEVRPGTKGLTGEKAERRRVALYWSVCAGIEAYYATYPAHRPKMDVECQPIEVSGGTRDENGREVASWGIPI